MENRGADFAICSRYLQSITLHPPVPAFPICFCSRLVEIMALSSPIDCRLYRSHSCVAHFSASFPHYTTFPSIGTASQNYATAQEQLALAYSTYKTNLIAEVNGLIAKKEFEQANERIEDASDILGNDEEYTALLSSVISTWEEDIIYTASELFGANKDYASAIRFLQLCGLQTNAIDAEITKYQDYVPIYLADLEYTQKTQYLNIGSHSDAITTDLQGTMYDGARLIYPTGGSLASDAASTEDEAYVNYYLGAKYSRLTGVLYVPYKSLSCPGEWKIPTIVKVYGDKALLFEAPAFTVDITEPLSIDIDITGVRELKIVMLGTWTEDTTWVGLYSRQPKVCAADFCISK